MSANQGTRTGGDFDLASLEGADRNLKRTSLYLVLGGIVWLGAILVLVLIYRLPTVESSGLSTSVGQGVVLGGTALAFSIAFLLLLIPSFLAGARRIRVDYVGLSVIYESGKVTRYPWNNPKSQFALQDYSAHPTVVKQGTAWALYGVHLWNRRSTLSKEAFDAILSAARERGLISSEYQGSPSWYPHPPVIYKVQGGPGR